MINEPHYTLLDKFKQPGVNTEDLFTPDGKFLIVASKSYDELKKTLSNAFEKVYNKEVVKLGFNTIKLDFDPSNNSNVYISHPHIYKEGATDYFNNNEIVIQKFKDDVVAFVQLYRSDVSNRPILNNMLLAKYLLEELYPNNVKLPFDIKK